MAGLRLRLEEVFGLDLRSLALFRIGLGAVLVMDLVKRSLTIRAHYTDDGVLPREAALGLLADPSIFRAYFLSGGLGAVVVLFLVSGIVALLLLLGFRARLMALLSLVLLVSLQLRNPLVCHTGDAYLAVLLFWGMFLPLGVHLSVDRSRPVAANDPGWRVRSVATAAFVVQIAVFYMAAGLLKHRHEVWTSGEALDVFLRIEPYTTRLGAFLSTMPWVTRSLTYFTLALEIFGPLLLLSPLRTGPVRTAAIALFAVFHLGIHLSVHIGLFEITSLVALSGLLPSWFWDGTRLGRRLSALAAPPPRPAVVARARRLRWSVDGIAAICLSLVLLSNYGSLTAKPLHLPEKIAGIGRPVGLIQNWEIFTDIDRQPRGWFLALGQLEDGTKVDVLNQRPFTGVSRPDRFSETYVNHNERRYWNLMAQERYRGFRPYLAEYLCREWNRRGGTLLTHLGVVHAHLPRDGTKQPLLEQLIVYRCQG